jgi:hypothetical protein
MPPATINLLVLGIEGDVGGNDLASAANSLRLLAERKDDAYFTRRGYESAAEFWKHFRRLSGIVVKKPQPAIWVNPQTKHAIPSDLINALRKLNGSGDNQGRS